LTDSEGDLRKNKTLLDLLWYINRGNPAVSPQANCVLTRFSSLSRKPVLVYGDFWLGPNGEMKQLLAEYGLVKVDDLNCLDFLLIDNVWEACQYRAAKSISSLYLHSFTKHSGRRPPLVTLSGLLGQTKRGTSVAGYSKAVCGEIFG